MFLSDIEEKDFLKDNIEFKWLSYNDLMNNKKIQQVNSDIVQFVKEFEL